MVGTGHRLFPHHLPILVSAAVMVPLGACAFAVDWCQLPYRHYSLSEHLPIRLRHVGTLCPIGAHLLVEGFAPTVGQTDDLLRRAMSALQPHGDNSFPLRSVKRHRFQGFTNPCQELSGFGLYSRSAVAEGFVRSGPPRMVV